MKLLLISFILITIICVCNTQKVWKPSNLEEITLTDEEPVRYIQSPGFPKKPYPKNFNMLYDIKVNLSDEVEQLASRISITLEYFAIEPSDHCRNDSLEVTFSSDESRVFCGVHAGKTMVSESTSATIQFRSNWREEGKGFKIRVEVKKSKCAVTFDNIRQGFIQTPNYPRDYRKEETCVWKISVPEGKFVKLSFVQPFDIYSSSSICGEDYLLISKTGDFDTDVHRHCGNETPEVIISNSNTMLLKFNSDCCNTGKGFTAKFIEHDMPEAAPERLPMLTPDSCPCGKENLKAFRIVGGSEVTPAHRYPWMVSIVTSRNSPFCGGVLINNYYVLTASHCVVDETEDTIRARVGQHSLSEPTPLLEISKIITHKRYDSVSQFNDIALLKLKNPVQFTKNILPVCLPPSDLEDPDGLFVAGWGRIDEGGRTSTNLHQLSLPKYSPARCVAKFGGLVTENHICAGGVKGQDACQGDSGGPLTSRIGNKVYVVGVVSWGIGCAREDSPGVYTKTTSYLKWIEENTRDSTYCLSPNDGTSNHVIEGPIQPNYDNCGLPNFYPTNRVVGGQEAQPHEFPWTVVIAYNGQLIGGGSLIAANVVLTSAQKLQPLVASSLVSNVKVIVGAHDITKSESNKRTYIAKQIRIHPQYAINTPYDYDFALIELTPTQEGFLTVHRPVCLVRSDMPYVVGNPVVGVGWGRTSTRGSGSQVLMKVVLSFANRRDCTTAYKNAVSQSMVCATENNRGLCVGDGGGPLMKSVENRMYLVGVMSFGDSECVKPSVFSDVRHALDWITDETGIKTA